MAATDKELSLLHKRVAEMMLRALDQQDGAYVLYTSLCALDREDTDAVNQLLDTLEIFMEKASEPNPALFQAVSKFLRDNKISAEVENNGELSEIERILQKKNERKQIRIGNVVALHDDE
jgi:hypothetical protein